VAAAPSAAPAPAEPAPAPQTALYSTFDPFLIYTNGPNGIVQISTLPAGTQINHAGYYLYYGTDKQQYVEPGVYTVPKP
jgi:hypothetical protein